jgi:hypothetical protein
VLSEVASHILVEDLIDIVFILVSLDQPHQLRVANYREIFLLKPAEIEHFFEEDRFLLLRHGLFFDNFDEVVASI